MKQYKIAIYALELFLKEQGKTLKEMADHLNYHQLPYKLKAGRPVTWDTVLNIAAYLGGIEPAQIVDPIETAILNESDSVTPTDKIAVDVIISNKAYEAFSIVAAFKGDTVDNLIARYAEASAARISNYIKEYTD